MNYNFNSGSDGFINNNNNGRGYVQTIDVLTSAQFEGLSGSIHENYSGPSDIDGFDLYDITSGNIIACDPKANHYEPSIRWDDTNTSNSDDGDVVANNEPLQLQQLNNIISPRLITVNSIDQVIPSSPISVPSNNAAVSPLQQPVNNNILNSMLKSTRSPVLVECKDMDPMSKINQLQPYVVETFPTQCSKFYRVIIDSSFWASVSEEMGFYEMNEGSWATSPSGCHQERILNFKTPISFKIGPKVATVTQVQKIRRTSTGGYFMETSSLSRDVPYGDSFSVENYISLEPANGDKDHCQLKVSTAVKFTKSIWGIGGLIEKSVIQSNKDFFVVWTRMARTTLEKAQNTQPNPVLNSINFLTPPQQSPNHSTQVVQVPTSPPKLNQPVPNKQLPPTPPPKTQHPAQQQAQDPNEVNVPNYEQIKRLFFQLFRETQNPRTIKIISQKTKQHVANITIHVHYTVGHVIQYLIPQALPELTNNQNFEFFWYDKLNEPSLFFAKDMDLPILNYLQSSDSLCITTITQQVANKKPLSFEIVQQGKRAVIKSNQQNVGISL